MQFPTAAFVDVRGQGIGVPLKLNQRLATVTDRPELAEVDMSALALCEVCLQSVQPVPPPLAVHTVRPQASAAMSRYDPPPAWPRARRQSAD